MYNPVMVWGEESAGKALGFIKGWKLVLSVNINIKANMFRIMTKEVEPETLEVSNGGLVADSDIRTDNIISDMIEPIKLIISDVYYQLADETVVIRCMAAPQNQTVRNKERIAIGNRIIHELEESGFEPLKNERIPTYFR